METMLRKIARLSAIGEQYLFRKYITEMDDKPRTFYFQGSAVDGAFLARNFKPDLKNTVELEVDMIHPIATVPYSYVTPSFFNNARHINSGFFDISLHNFDDTVHPCYDYIKFTNVTNDSIY